MANSSVLTLYFADLTYYQQGLQSEIMPYAIGTVAAFAKHKFGPNVDIRIFKHPNKLIAALKEKTPDVMAFSNYAWNGRLSCAFARAFKARHPLVPVIMGGPNYPLSQDQQIQFLRDHPQVDFYVIKEAEVAFSQLVAALRDNAFDLTAQYDIPSVHYLDADGTAHLPDPAPRIEDLSQVPSPYLEGLLDEFFSEGFWPIIQTNRGCPFTCTFCVEGTRYYSKVYNSTTEKVQAELDYIGKRMVPVIAAGGRADLFIADSNFGMFKDDISTCKAIRECQDRYGWPQYISVATGKNQKERVLEAAALVRGALRLSGSVQSLDSEVLDNIKRKNVSADQIMQVAMQGAEIGANTYSEVILALPGDTRQRHMDTISQLMEAGFNKVETYTLMLLPGSEMDSVETRAEFGFETKFRIIPRCFGYFDYDGETISVGEIEEVVVGNNTMPFADYVECRVLALIIVLFHNDGLFHNAFRLLKQLDLKVFDCIGAIEKQAFPPELAALVDAFRDETRNELWDSRDELAAYMASPANVENYISGKMGSNLLFKYKSIAMLEHVEALAKVVAAALEQVITDKIGPLNPAQHLFVQHLSSFGASSALNIFKGFEEDVVLTSPFDIAAVLDEEGRFLRLGDSDLQAARVVRFCLDDTQRQTIIRTLNTYGTTISGLTRALTRVNLKRLLRTAAVTAPASGE